MNNSVLKYLSPADKWTDCLPVGSGRLGAMIQGGIKRNICNLNEVSLWSGAPFENADRPNAHEHLTELRNAIDDGDYKKAQDILDEHFTNFGGGFEGAYSCSYQTLGDIIFESDIPDSEYKNYIRRLSLSDAVYSDSFDYGDCTFNRYAFASNADDVIVFKFESSKKERINLKISFARLDIAKIRYTDSGFSFYGYCDNDRTHLKFAGQCKIIAGGGSVSSGEKYTEIKNSNSAVVIFTAATDYILNQSKNFKGEDPVKKCEKIINSASNHSYDELLSRHKKEFESYYDVSSVSIADNDNRTVDELLKDSDENGASPALCELFFNYGKYLIISSSRPNNTLPANLQGIWCNEYDPPWHSDYHTNINVQMNYWPAGPLGLAELTEPFAKLICALPENGRKTAKAYYNADGWTLYTITSPWLWTSPGWGGGWSQYPLGGAWLCRHLVEYYNYTSDKELLKRFYPVILENCIFNIELLCEDSDKSLITNPSTSPENSFRTDDGLEGWVCKGNTMDIEMLYDNFTDMIRLSEILDTDARLRSKLENLRDRLKKLHIGKEGQLCEWYGDWDMNAPEIHHRHVSHLYGLHPGSMINVLESKELASACRKSLEIRGDDGTGWSLAWKINFWARLRDGNRALKLIKRLLSPVGENGRSIRYKTGGGVYRNLFDAHPPFQIDGNFGAAAGICEMLMQSHVYSENSFVIDLLPALPDEWENGSFTRLKARGNITVNAEWNNGRLEKAELIPENNCVIKLYGDYSVSPAVDSNLKNGVTSFSASKGTAYTVKLK